MRAVAWRPARRPSAHASGPSAAAQAQELRVFLELTFKNYRPAEVLAYLPIVERSADRTIRYEAADIVEISRFLQFVGNYRSDLSP